MRNTSDAVNSTRPKIGALAALGAVLLGAACGSNNGSSPASSSDRRPLQRRVVERPQRPAGASSGATSSGTGPVGVEVHPPGDIPDNQAFVPYPAAGSPSAAGGLGALDAGAR